MASPLRLIVVPVNGPPAVLRVITSPAFRLEKSLLPVALILSIPSKIPLSFTSLILLSTITISIPSPPVTLSRPVLSVTVLPALPAINESKFMNFNACTSELPAQGPSLKRTPFAKSKRIFWVLSPRASNVSVVLTCPRTSVIPAVVCMACAVAYNPPASVMRPDSVFTVKVA